MLPLSNPAGPGRWERAVRSLPLAPHLDWMNLKMLLLLLTYHEPIAILSICRFAYDFVMPF